MLNKTILVILLLKLHLTIIICLKSTEFCVRKQQECKGFYDRTQNYEIKCNKVKCHGTFKHECESNICSNNITACEDYSKMNIKENIIRMNNFYESRQILDLEKIKYFKTHLKDCKIKIYEFKSNDFCVNERDCKIILGYLYQISRPFDCICPKNQSFKCDKYCTTSSIDKSMRNKKKFADIKKCANQKAINYNHLF